jgi:hypothetical protein
MATKLTAAQQLAAKKTGQPVPLNTNIAPPAGTTPTNVAGQPNSAAAIDPFGQAAGRVALNQSTNPANGQPTAADIAQLTGLDVNTVIQMQNGDVTTQLQLQGLVNAAQTKQQNQNYIQNNYMPAGIRAGNQEDVATQGMQQTATNQANLAGGLLAGYGQAVGSQQGLANTANAADQSALAGYGQNLGVASGMQAGAYNQLAGTYGSMGQLSPTAISANVQAQTSAAQLANYQQAQYQSYIAQGYSPTQAQYELANTEQAQYQKAGLSQASSDQGDVTAERGALGQLSNIAGGSLDTTNGQGSGGGLAAQQSALAQYGALTSPQATAKEKFLYEQQREAQEQQEAASRGALMNDYRTRGVGGSGMELASILQGGQQNSQQRLLGDLGTQAGAVDRSMQALAGYGNLSTQMTAQGNQVAQANAANRLGAAGAQGNLAGTIRGQGDTLSMYNTGQANQNSQFNADAFNTNSMFNTGQANTVGMFNAGQYNQANQFNANAVNQSNAFNANANNNAGQFNANAFNNNSQFNANAYNANSQFNAAATNQNNQFNNNQINQTNQFNTSQNMVQSRFADQYAADQQQQAALRASDLASQGITVGQNFATNSGNAFQAQRNVSDTGYARGTDVTNLGVAGLTAGYNAGTTANQAQTAVNQQQIQNAGNQFGRTLAIGGQWTGNNSAGTTAVGSAINTASGDAAAQAAAAAAAKAPAPGPLGLWTIPTSKGQTGQILGVNYRT